jgi:xyloglucan-specific exo-beta-1,4-glucanase
MRNLAGMAALGAAAISLTLSTAGASDAAAQKPHVAAPRATAEKAYISAPKDYVWKNVQISGANAWVTGITAHPKQKGLFYIRTDVGGAYRWDSAKTSWVPLNDSIPFSQRNYYGGEAVGLDPNDANVVYYAGGAWLHGGNGTIMKSTDQGATWKKLPIDVPMGGNQERRWAGDRLAVSPSNAKVVLFGSRTKGLWRSSNAGASWAAAPAIPTATDTIGVQSIAFDATKPGMVYAAVSENGVYKSTDDGATWASIGGDAEPQRIAVGGDGVLWYANRAGISKYASGGWTDCAAGGPGVYNALAINPNNPKDVLVGKGETSKVTLYRTLDGGETWTKKPARFNSTVGWWHPGTSWTVSNLAFDPSNTKAVWADNSLTTDIDADTVNFYYAPAGHEEDCTLCIATPPTGTELFTGIMDVDGFAHDKGLDEYPSRTLGGGAIGYTLSIAYEEKDPANMIRVGAQNFDGNTTVVKSSDNGRTWKRVAFPKGPVALRCAMSATDPNDVVVIAGASANGDPTLHTWKPVPSTDPCQHSTDGGETWHVVTGLPTPPDNHGMFSNGPSLVADTVKGGVFYYTDRDGKVYRSTDGGAMFSWINDKAGQTLPGGGSALLKVRPGVEGDLWMSLDNDNANVASDKRSAEEGLYHSTDGGATWKKVAGVTRAWLFSFGKGQKDRGVPALYLYGRLTGDSTEAIYRSLDLGKTWMNVSDPRNPIGDVPMVMEGSRQNFGVVFVGTSGRGVFYGAPKADDMASTGG